MNTLTPNIACEVFYHEGLVCSAYKDGKGVWTWAGGVTDASGHYVRRYIGNPQPLDRCIGVSVWLMQTHYLPAVLRAFGYHQPTECELGAALSFHYNTGAIEHTDWIKLFLNGQVTAARHFLETHYTDGDLTERRKKEAELFFDGKWSNDGTALLYEVDPKTFHPIHPQRVAIRPAVIAALAA